MNAQAILEKIGADGRQAAAVLLKEAKERAEATRAASDQKIAKLREQTLSQARAEAEVLEQRMHRMAELDERKLLLTAKRELMDQAFEAAMQKLRQMAPGQAEAFFLSLVVSAANGTEVLVLGEDNSNWFSLAFVDKANAALTSTGKPGKLTLSPERRCGLTGVILLSEGMEINSTLEAIVASRRLDLEAEVAAILYE